MRFSAGWSESLVRVAHDSASSPEEWVDRVTDHLADRVDGLGVASRLVAVEPRTSFGYTIRTERPALLDALREHEARSEHRIDFLTKGTARGLRAVDSGRAALRDPYLAEMGRRFRSAGMGNMLHWTMVSDGLCVTVGLLVGPGERLEAAPHVLQRVGDHLASAFDVACRARALGQSAPNVRTGERSRLRAEVRAATDRGDTTAGARATEVWEGLLRGTWSMVDRHDHQGRGYIVACPRPHGAAPDPRSLSRQEAQVVALAASGHADKWIAYELGISRSTVATHLQTALEKLSIGSRLELVRAYRAVD